MEASELHSTVKCLENKDTLDYCRGLKQRAAGRKVFHTAIGSISSVAHPNKVVGTVTSKYEAPL